MTQRSAGVRSAVWLTAALLSACGGSQPAAPPAEEVAAAPAVLEQIESLHRAGRYEEGLELARAALREHPEAPLLHHALGVMLGSTGDHRAAIREFEAELARDPDHFDSLRGLATATTQLGEIEASLPYLERCLEPAPGDAEISYPLGRNLAALGRFEAAEPHLLRAAETRQGTAAEVELGKLYRQLGDDERAALAFRRALDRDPYDLAALSNLGQTLQRLGRGQEGEALLRAYERVAPQIERLRQYEQASRLPTANAANFVLLARLYRDLGRDADAIAAYERALQLVPEAPGVVAELAAVELRTGDLERAEKWVELDQVLAPETPTPLFLRALLRLRQGRPDEAAADVEASRQRGEWAAAAFLELGDAYAHAGQPAAAARAYAAALEGDPESARGHYALALARALAGRREEALASAGRAVEIDPYYGDAWMLTGILRFPSSAPAAEAAFRSALEAQIPELLRPGAVDERTAPFADLAGAGPALELYRRLAESAEPVRRAVIR
jgi:protein O-GlcNAc transferase